MFKSVNANENFPEMEKKWLKHWYEKGIVKKAWHGVKVAGHVDEVLEALGE